METQISHESRGPTISLHLGIWTPSQTNLLPYSPLPQSTRPPPAPAHGLIPSLIPSAAHCSRVPQSAPRAVPPCAAAPAISNLVPIKKKVPTAASPSLPTTPRSRTNRKCRADAAPSTPFHAVIFICLSPPLDATCLEVGHCCPRTGHILIGKCTSTCVRLSRPVLANLKEAPTEHRIHRRFARHRSERDNPSACARP